MSEADQLLALGVECPTCGAQPRESCIAMFAVQASRHITVPPHFQRIAKARRRGLGG